MRALTASDCLQLWDSGVDLHPLDRSLLALSVAIPELPRESFADWSLGRRNVAMAWLYGKSFGTGLNCWMQCPRCGEKLEYQMDTRQLTGEPMEKSPAELIHLRGHSFRLPTSRDLAATSGISDPNSVATAIVSRCLIDSPTRTDSPPVWSDEDLEEIGDEMAKADPMAEIALALHCPMCQHDWEDLLDLPSFLWAQIQVRAKRLLQDVHTLASAYGWAEATILNLSDSRRSAYLEMVRQ